MTLCTVLPVIGSLQRPDHDARTVSLLRGNLTDGSHPEPDSVRLYLCYDFEGKRSVWQSLAVVVSLSALD